MIFKSSRQQYGFSLIELVMVLMIIGVISVVVSRILLQSGLEYTTANNIGVTDWQGFAVLSRMTEDIHNVRSKNDISTINSTEFVFTDADGTSVQYTLSGNTLLRNAQTLATGVTGLAFGYLTSAGVATNTPASVRYISISLSTSQGNITSSFSTLVGTRGLS